MQSEWIQWWIFVDRNLAVLIQMVHHWQKQNVDGETNEKLARAQVVEHGWKDAPTIGSSTVGKFYGPIRGQGHAKAANAALDEVRGGIGGEKGEMSSLIDVVEDSLRVGECSRCLGLVKIAIHIFDPVPDGIDPVPYPCAYDRRDSILQTDRQLFQFLD